MTDSLGNLFFADQFNNRVRTLTPDGVIGTLAGNGGVFSGNGAQATDAQFYKPTGVAIDANGNILVADGGNARIRKIDPGTGEVTTIAGTGSFTVSGDNGPAIDAGLGLIQDVAAGAGGVVYIATSNLGLGGTDSRIWKIAANGVISTIAGGAVSGFSGDLGPATLATLNFPQGIAVDANGNVYIADTFNNRVRRINASDGTIVTVAGTGVVGSAGDGGPATSAQLNAPTKLAFDSSGNLYIADRSNTRTRKVAPNGTISLFLLGAGMAVAAGNGSVFAASSSQISRTLDAGGLLNLASGFNGISRDNGPSLVASINPWALAVTSSGAVIFADLDNNAIRQITPVAATSGVLSVSPAGVLSRGGNPTNLITLSVSIGGNFPWTATTSDSWLSLSSTSGTGNAQITLTVNSTGLTPGIYNGSVTFTSPNAVNGSFTVPVTLNPLASSAIVSLSSSLTITSSALGSTFTSTLFILNASATSTITISPSPSVITPPGGSWLSVSPPSFSATNVLFNAVTVTFNTAGLAAGTYTGTVTVTSPDAVNSPLTIPVTLILTAPAAPTVTSVSPVNGSQGQTVDVTLFGTNFVTGATTVAVSGTGVTVSTVTVTSTSALTARLVIDPGATVSARTITATTSAGTTGAVTFTILGPPTLTSLSPASAGRGRTVNVALIGTNFPQNATFAGISGTGVTVLNIVPSTLPTSRTVTLVIAPDATPGPRSLTVSTPAGTTSTVTFTVTLSPGFLISRVAGRSVIIEGGTATTQPLPPPNDIAFDSLGNLYIVASNGNKVYKVTPAGALSTFAGTGIAGPAGDGGPATAAQLNAPRSVVVDSNNNVLIAETGNSRVRKVAPDGTITTFAGTGSFSFSGDGGPAVYATLANPYGLGIDAAGNVYISDVSNGRIRKVDASGIITTVAGNGTFGLSGDGFQAVSAQLNLTLASQKLAVDAAGNLYIPDSVNNRIRKVASNGTITTFAGKATFGFSGDGGLATAAMLNSPRAVLVDSSGNVFISDFSNNRIRRVTNGTITTVAGNGGFGYTGGGTFPTSRPLSNPAGLAADGAGNLHIADTGANRVRKLASGAISTVAGGGAIFSGEGGPALNADMYNPNGVALAPNGDLLIADSRNFVIRRVNSSGTIVTIAGIGVNSFAPDGTLASSAAIGFVTDLTIDSTGTIYFIENSRVRKIGASDGLLSTVAGNGVGGFGGDGGPALSAMLNSPQGLAGVY